MGAQNSKDENGDNKSKQKQDSNRKVIESTVTQKYTVQPADQNRLK